MIQILIFIMTLFIIVYSIHIIKNLLCVKFKDDSDASSVYRSNRTTLKGRIRKNANNINYSELFVDEEKNKKATKKEVKKPIKEEPVKTLDEFFETIYEQNDVSNYLNNLMKKHPEPIQQTQPHIKKEEIFITGDLLTFEEKPKEMLTVEDLCLKKNSTQPVTNTNIDHIDILIVKEEKNDNEPENVLNDSSTLEYRMRNKDLFSQTPMLLIRNKK